MRITKNNKIYIKAAKRESEFWEWFIADENLEIPKEIQEYGNLRLSWNKDINYTDYIKSLWKFNKWLCIWWWSWIIELNFIKDWVVNNMHFVDFSSSSVSKLHKNAESYWVNSNITSEIWDLNFLEFWENKYDLILCRWVLHHIINLEELLYNLNNSLTNNWIIIIEDYIWESKFQRSDLKVSYIKFVQEYFKNKFWIPIKDYSKTNVKVLTNNSPFEAIRSTDLEWIINYYFWENIIKHLKFWYLKHIYFELFNEFSNKVFNELEDFENIIINKHIFSPVWLFWIYNKSNKPLLKSTEWNNKEINSSIWVSIINEKVLLKLWNKLKMKNEKLFNFLKIIYFKFR